MVRVVLDTNVLVSAFLKKGSAPVAILTLAEEGNIYLCVSRAVMEEYEGVLQRDKFRPFGQRAVEYLRKARKTLHLGGASRENYGRKRRP